MSPADRQRQSARICERVRALDQFRAVEIVLLYRSLPSEVDVAALWEQCRGERRTVFAPRVDAATRDLRFIRVTEQTAWRASAQGIWEPATGDELTAELAARATIIVPGIGFSYRGERMGRGAGYYDRALTKAPIGGCGYRVGVAFDAQVVERLPVDSLDVPMHAVVAASNVWFPALPLGAVT